MDGRRNNGGHKTAGRKSKAKELELLKHGTEAIEQVYGDLTKYWVHIAKESKDSFPHLKLLTEYLYGKPSESLDVTTNGDNLTPPQILFTKRDKDK